MDTRRSQACRSALVWNRLLSSAREKILFIPELICLDKIKESTELIFLSFYYELNIRNCFFIEEIFVKFSVGVIFRPE